jgi:hypothetical protein
MRAELEGEGRTELVVVRELRASAHSPLLVGQAAGEVPVSRSFSVGPPPNRTCSFHCIRLSSVSFRCVPLQASVMDFCMALVAND